MYTISRRSNYFLYVLTVVVFAVVCIGPETVSAQVCPTDPVGILGSTTSFSSIRAAYDTVKNIDGSVIRAKATVLKENIIFDYPVAATIAGGYDDCFNDNPYVTDILGTMIIAAGTITIDHLAIGDDPNPVLYSVASSAGPHGSISPATTLVTYGDAISFAVTPDPDYHIATVTGCSGTLVNGIYTTGPITGDCAVEATFAINPFMVAMNTTGTGKGRVTLWPGEVVCGNACSPRFEDGSTVMASPTPEYGSVFAGWSGGCSGTDLCIVTVKGDISITAIFDLLPLSANFIASPPSAPLSYPIRFFDLSSNVPTSWYWTFGDGGDPSTEQNPVHVYGTPGNYAVSLTVTNAGGAVSTKTRTDYITICNDTTSDVQNCGFCGNVCPSAATSCNAGECVYTCDPGFPDCALVDVAPGAWVVNSSPTDPGNALSNALDGDPDNNYTSFTGPLPATFRIGFGREVRVVKIELVWDSDADYATDYTIRDVDFSGSVFQVVTDASSKTGMSQQITLASPVKSTYLGFSITGMTGSKLILRQIKVYAEQPTAFEALMNSDASIYQKVLLDTNDVSNPLHTLRRPFIHKYALIADAMLAGSGTLTPHEKILKFISLTDNFKLGNASSTYPEDELKERIGVCGHFSPVASVFATSQGIPARIVGLYNYPKNNGHSIAQFYTNGRWQIYDTTYNAYYTTDPANMLNPLVLSLDELRAGGGTDPTVTSVVVNQARCNSQSASCIAFSGPAIYEQAAPAGPIGLDHPFFFPQHLDPVGYNTLTGADLWSPAHQGAAYLGLVQLNYNQDFSLTSLVPGFTYTLSMTPGGIDGEELTAASVFNAGALSLDRSCTITGGDTYSATPGSYPAWNVTFVPLNSSCTIRLAHSYMGPNRFFLYISSYELFQQ